MIIICFSFFLVVIFSWLVIRTLLNERRDRLKDLYDSQPERIKQLEQRLKLLDDPDWTALEQRRKRAENVALGCRTVRK